MNRFQYALTVPVSFRSIRGAEKDVLNLLKTVGQVRKTSLNCGVYDLGEAQFKTMEELDDFVINTVRKIPGVKNTATPTSSRVVFSQ